MKGESIGKDVLGSPPKAKRGFDYSRWQQIKDQTELEKHKVDSTERIEKDKIGVERDRVKAIREDMKRQQDLNEQRSKFEKERSRDEGYRTGVEDARNEWKEDNYSEKDVTSSSETVVEDKPKTKIVAKEEW